MIKIKQQMVPLFTGFILMAGQPLAAQTRIREMMNNAARLSVVPSISISDVSKSEGNSGTTIFTFLVNLSAAAGPDGVTFDIATANNTATTSNSDYQGKSLPGQTIPEGSSTYMFDVLVNGDNSVEPNETFLVNLTNITGASLLDGQGLGIITNDDILCPFTNNRVYVKANASGANNGSGWADAFTSLQSAIDAVKTCPVSEIWVSRGTYKPSVDESGNANPADPRTKTFLLPDGVKLFGGFVGNETIFSQRTKTTILANQSMLSGDLAGNDGSDFANNDENAYHVVVSVNDNSNTELNGFTIAAGNANVSGTAPIDGANVNRAAGGGIHFTNSMARVVDCILYRNSSVVGSGMTAFLSNIYLVETRFVENKATNAGGGLYCNSTNATLMGCVFSYNQGPTGGGGLLVNGPASVDVYNSVFYSNNSSPVSGGGVFIQNNGVAGFTNCTFNRNTSVGGAAIAATLGGSSTLSNCIVYGNNGGNFVAVSGASLPTARYSLIQGNLYPGTGNINDVPLYVNPADGDGPDNFWRTADDGLMLQNCSPAIDAGNDAEAIGSTDLAGNPRLYDGIAGGSLVDMGAYENQDGTCLRTWYFDYDNDGFGNSAKSVQSFTRPKRYVTKPGDCRDWDPLSYPGAPEIGDGIDNNCNGQVDEGLDCLKTWYYDGDGDGYGSDAHTRLSCIQHNNFVASGGDCRNWDARVFPGATELCDGKDNDCDGLTDEACGLITGTDSGKPETATKPLAKAESAAQQLDIRLWPNPARDVLMVTLDAFVPNQKMELTLMQSDGKIQQSQSLVPTLKGQQVKMDVSRAAAGYYILLVKQQGMMINRQVVMVR